MAWAFHLRKKIGPDGLEIPVHWNDYTPLLIAKPTPFQFDAVPRDNEKRLEMGRMWLDCKEDGDEFELWHLGEPPVASPVSPPQEARQGRVRQRQRPRRPHQRARLVERVERRRPRRRRGQVRPPHRRQEEAAAEAEPAQHAARARSMEEGVEQQVRKCIPIHTSDGPTEGGSGRHGDRRGDLCFLFVQNRHCHPDCFCAHFHWLFSLALRATIFLMSDGFSFLTTTTVITGLELGSCYLSPLMSVLLFI